MVEKIIIHKFRKFHNSEIALGKKITIIAGKNGTQKTTLLGILGHPFSMSGKDSFSQYETLMGTKFQSKMTNKFRFSPTFDKPGEHQWDVHFDMPDIYDGVYPVKSMPRGGDSDDIRFWHATDRSKGSGYIQLPVIFLSLQRLFPMGEAKLNKSFAYSLTDQEVAFFQKHYKEILILREELRSPGIMVTPNKKTLAAGGENYDEFTISAGQDNIGQILMAVMSFKRLKENFPSEYKGGLLLIDELDATLYPAAQEKLIQKLYRFASDLKLQIIATTHSMDILRCARNNIDSRNSEDTKILYLRSRDDDIVVEINPTVPEMENHLRVEASKPQIENKIHLYCEDPVGMMFIKSLLGSQLYKHVHFIDVNIGAEQLKDLIKRHIPEFVNSIIVLDGDKANTKKYRNLIVLPGTSQKLYPECIFYRFLQSLPESDSFWTQEIGGYDKDVCFRNCVDESGGKDTIKAWFNDQKQYWGRGASKMLKRWKNSNPDEVRRIKREFEEAYNFLARKIGIDTI